jgi:hypothetical protein
MAKNPDRPGYPGGIANAKHEVPPAADQPKPPAPKETPLPLYRDPKNRRA